MPPEKQSPPVRGSDKNGHIRTCISWLVVLALALLFIEVLFSGKALAYDEPCHLQNCLILQKYGVFSVTFLRGGVSASSGPLFSIIYGYTSPLTHYHAVVMRMMDLAMSIIVLWIWIHIMKRLKVADAALRTMMSFCVPAFWVISGMVLAEMPALICVSLSVLMIMKALEIDEVGEKWISALYVGGASLFLSVAIAARSMFLIVPFLFLLSSLLTHKFNPRWIIFMLIGLSPAAGLIYVWGGFVPPGIHHNFHGSFSLENGVRGLATFAAIAWAMTLEKRFLPLRTLVKIFGAAFFINLITGIVQVFPYMGTGVYASGLKAHITRVTASFVVGFIACVTAVALTEAYRAYRERDTLDLWFIFCAGGQACLPFLMTFQFSTRYVFESVPFLMFALKDRISLSAWRIPVLIYCIYAGFISLNGYYYSREGGQNAFPIGNHEPRVSMFQWWY